MARDLTRCLRPGGHLILAGLLARHEAMVLGAYRRQGLHLVAHACGSNAWSTLVLDEIASKIRNPSAAG